MSNRFRRRGVYAIAQDMGELDGIGDRATISGATTIGERMLSWVEFSTNLGNYPRSDVRGPPFEALESVWPLTSGTITYRFEPSDVVCLDATRTTTAATGLAAVPADGSPRHSAQSRDPQPQLRVQPSRRLCLRPLTIRAGELDPSPAG
jgi:hypothetical protein